MTMHSKSRSIIKVRLDWPGVRKILFKNPNGELIQKWVYDKPVDLLHISHRILTYLIN